MGDDNPVLRIALALSEISIQRDVAEMEVERLQAENAALRRMVDLVANGGDANDFSERAGYRLLYRVYASDETRAQARALLTPMKDWEGSHDE